MARRWAALAALLGLWLGACGGRAAAPVDAPAATPAAAPTTLTVALASEPADLQPDARINDAGYAIEQDIFNKLVTLDYGYNVVPDLARSWEVSADGLTYTFHL